MRITRLSTSLRHCEAGSFFEQVLIRRGGVPSGAVAFITNQMQNHQRPVQVRFPMYWILRIYPFI